MRTSFLTRKTGLTLVLIILSGVLAQDDAFGQRPPRSGGDRGGRSRDDTSSLLMSIRNRETVEKLKLTPDQEKQLSDLRGEYFRGFRGLSPEESEKARKETEDKALNILDAEQKQSWQKIKEAAQAAAGSPPAAGGAVGGVVRAENSAVATRGAIPDEKPPEGERAVVSFGPVAAMKVSLKEENEDEEDSKPSLPYDIDAAEEANLSFEFRYAPWADVLKLFADANDLTLDLNDVPPGTFNYYDTKKQYTMTQALDILNGYLLSKGYVLVRRDRFLVCVSVDTPIPPNIIPNVTMTELQKRGKNEILNLILPLTGLDADSVVGEVKELLGPQGKVSALKSTNSLVMTDTGSNLRRVALLMTTSTPVDKRETAFKSIALKYISAADAERMVRRLFNLNPPISSTANTQGFGGFGGGGRFGGGGNPFGGGGNPFGGGGNPFGGGGNPFGGGGGDPRGGGGAPAPAAPSSQNSPYIGKIQVTADTRTNHLLVTASAALIKVVEEAVKALDVNQGADGTDLGAMKNNPTIPKSYSVRGGDSASVARALNTVMPGVVLGDDSRSGKIFTQATKDEHIEIERFIKEFSGETSGSVTVIKLTKNDPGQVTNSLRNLFANDTNRAPSIEPDANGRQILVRGTADQLLQVKELLRKLGEPTDPLDTNDSSAPIDRGTVRHLRTGTHDPNEILGLVQRNWSASGRSPFRIVIPSQPSPIRERRVPGDSAPNLRTEPVDDDSPQALPQEDVRPRSADRDDNAPKNGPNAPRQERLVPEQQFAPRPKPRPATTQLIPRPQASVKPAAKIPVQLVSQKVLTEETDGETKDGTESKPSDEEAPAVVNDTKQDPETPAKTKPQPKREVSTKTTANGVDPSIAVTVQGNEIILTGPDGESLDELEDLITALVDTIPQRTRWTVFYLKTADATETAQMIERFFPQSSVTSSPVSSSDNSLFGSFTSGLSRLGSGMMSATGLNQTLGGAQNLRVITDVRSNALFVAGPPDLVRDVEYMLELLDAGELPQSLRDRVPRWIPVEHADIDDVAEIIENVFKDAMAPEQQNQQQMNPFAMMMGGGGNRQQNGRTPKGPELTLGIDRQTSHLIVSCNDAMFHKVEMVVQSIDKRSKDARRSVRIVQLNTADPVVVQSTLTSLLPKVTVSSTRSKSRKKDDQAQAPNPADPASMQRGGQPGGGRGTGRTGGGGQPGGGGNPFGGGGGNPFGGGGGNPFGGGQPGGGFQGGGARGGGTNGGGFGGGGNRGFGGNGSGGGGRGGRGN